MPTVHCVAVPFSDTSMALPVDAVVLGVSAAEGFTALFNLFYSTDDPESTHAWAVQSCQAGDAAPSLGFIGCVGDYAIYGGMA